MARRLLGDSHKTVAAFHQLGAGGGRSCGLGVSREFPRESFPVNFVLGQEATAFAYVVGELSELPCGTHEF